MNPEFRRNLWLELTLHRLVALPIVVILIGALLIAINPEEATTRIAIAAALGAVMLLAVWGTNAAGDAIPEEVRAKTWDTQRMSAIAPWTMTWGKLFGATSYAWYGGGVCVAILLATGGAVWPHSVPEIALLIVALSLLAQALACLGGLAVARKGHVRHGGLGGWLLLIVFVFMGPGVSVLREGARAVAWWGGEYALLRFTLGSTLVFAGWAVFALYRMLCIELQVRTTPWAFAAFALFLTAYLTGFSRQGAGALPAWGLAVCAALTYLFLFTEQTGAIVFRRLQVRVGRRDLRGALTETPCWMVGVALAAAFALAAGVGGTAGEGVASLSRSPLPVVLLLVRDAALFLVFAFARAPRRVETTTLVYLALLYGGLPWLLHAADLPAVADLVLPPLMERPVYAAFVAGGHCAIACAVAAWRWRRLQTSLE